MTPKPIKTRSEIIVETMARVKTAEALDPVVIAARVAAVCENKLVLRELIYTLKEIDSRYEFYQNQVKRSNKRWTN